MMTFRSATIVGKGVDPDVYNVQTAERGTIAFIQRPSELKEFIWCASRWKDGFKRDSEAKRWGNLMDCATLSPEEFAAKYVVEPETYPASKKNSRGAAEGDPIPWNNNATYCRDWTTEMKMERGLKVIHRDDFAEAKLAGERFKANDDIREFIESSEKQIHVRGEYVARNGLVIPVQCLIDLAPKLVSAFRQSLGDLKTARSLHPVKFERQIDSCGYDLQGAFDIDLYNLATGEKRDSWCLIGQENYPPYETTKGMLSQDFLELGRQKYRKALEHYAECVASGKWPSYRTPIVIDGWNLYQPAPYMFGSDEAEHEPVEEKGATEPDNENDFTP